MAAGVFDIALGQGNKLGQLGLTHDAILWIILQSAGLQGDDLLRQNETLAALLAAGNTEATFTGYSRIVHRASISVVLNHIAGTQAITDSVPPTWTPTTSQGVGKIIACYCPDSTSYVDANVVPLVYDDTTLSTTTSGNPIVYPVPAVGFFVAD